MGNVLSNDGTTLVTLGDNNKLYYSKPLSPTLQLIDNPDNISVDVDVNFDDVYNMVLSNDGNTLVVKETNNNLYYSKPLSSPLQLITNPTDVTNYSSILLSNDGNRLVVLGNNGKVYYTQLLSSPSLQLINNPDNITVNATDYSILLSDDGNTLVVTGSNDNLYYSKPLSSPLQLITNPTDVTNYNYILLSGDTLVIRGNNSNLYYSKPLSSTLQLITNPTDEITGYYSILLSDDGNTLVVRGDNRNLYYSKPLSSSLQLITNPTDVTSYSSISLSDDGNTLVVQGDNNNLYYTQSFSSPLQLITKPTDVISYNYILLSGDTLVVKGNNDKLYYSQSFSSPLQLIDWPTDVTDYYYFIYLSDDGNTVVVRGNNNKLYYSNPISSTLQLISFPTIANICFPKGTPILTDQGLLAINEIDPDVNTINQMKIVDITKTVSKESFLVCFEKDALGLDMPSQQTIISPGHQLIYKEEMHEAKWFMEKFAKVKSIPYTGEILYNVLLEKHDTMNVNNLICETLLPSNPIAKFYTKQCKLSTQDRDIMIKVLQSCLDRNDIASYNQILQCC